MEQYWEGYTLDEAEDHGYEAEEEEELYCDCIDGYYNCGCGKIIGYSDPAGYHTEYNDY